MKVVAIDGPAGAGKSTIAKLLAARVGIPYLDTGAMYRVVTLACSEFDVALEDEDALHQLVNELVIHVGKDAVLMNGRDVTTLIRTSAVNAAVSAVAANSVVRGQLRTRQRDWVRQMGGGIVEGRDIATVVFPDACLKVFLTASVEERARRRVEQAGGELEAVAREIAQRDARDSSRSDGPMVIAPDAVLVDTTSKSVDSVIDELVALVRDHCG